MSVRLVSTLKPQHQPRPWRCTSSSAGWCPLCGTCSCAPEGPAAETCALHGSHVEHPNREGLVL